MVVRAISGTQSSSTSRSGWGYCRIGMSSTNSPCLSPFSAAWLHSSLAQRRLAARRCSERAGSR